MMRLRRSIAGSARAAAVLAVLLATGQAAAAGPPPPPPPVQDDTVIIDEVDDPAVDAEPVADEQDDRDPVVGGAAAATLTEPKTEPSTATPSPNKSPSAGEPGFQWWRSKYLTIGGYVQPQYTYRARRNARPRDQQEFGAGQTRAGLRFSGEPMDRWFYNVHLVIGAQILQPITDVQTVDYDGDGAIDTVATSSRPAPGIFIEELSVAYRPVDYHGPNGDAETGRDVVTLDLELGQMRIPFTAQNRSQNSTLMFPRRSTPNNVFLSGTDLGGLVRLGILDDTVDILGGIYNGTGLAVSETNNRGALYAGRLDVNPLGGFPYAEGDLGRGKFKFGVGAGLLYYPTKVFYDAGNDTRTRARDLRASASFRMQVRGFYLQGEFLRRQRTDSLSNLPQVATGAYGQTSFFFPIKGRLGAAPVGRFGWTTLDQSFDPLVTYYGDAGAALYIGNGVRPDVLRVLLQYLGEVRVTEQEQGHGAALQVQLRW
ncbi:MAG: hypothetical protein JKY37_06750 [Nannocystaceae bacterium]|nr:hypothetical protein [Nannocystaceae bacterium]